MSSCYHSDVPQLLQTDFISTLKMCTSSPISAFQLVTVCLPEELSSEVPSPQKLTPVITSPLC